MIITVVYMIGHPALKDFFICERIPGSGLNPSGRAVHELHSHLRWEPGPAQGERRVAAKFSTGAVPHRLPTEIYIGFSILMRLSRPDYVINSSPNRELRSLLTLEQRGGDYAGGGAVPTLYQHSKGALINYLLETDT